MIIVFVISSTTLPIKAEVIRFSAWHTIIYSKKEAKAMIPMLMKRIDKQTFENIGDKDVLGTKERAKDRITYFITHLADYHRYPNEVNRIDNISTKEAYDNVEYKEGEFFSTVAARGCIHYTYFISTAIYGRRSFFEPFYGKIPNRLELPMTKGKTTVAKFKKFVDDNLQAGEHYRVENAPHSLIFIASDKEGQGFYSLDYHGWDTTKKLYYDDGPHLAYNTYENWVSTINYYGGFAIYNSVSIINQKGPSTNLRIEPDTITIEAGKTVRLRPIFDGIDQQITAWSVYSFCAGFSKDNAVVTVDENGHVVGNKEGMALIFVKSEKGLVAQVTIYVVEPTSMTKKKSGLSALFEKLTK